MNAKIDESRMNEIDAPERTLTKSLKKVIEAAAMTFFKDFVNVLSGASISFILLSSIFAFIVYFNLLGGRLKSKGGYGFVAFGALLLVTGIFITPLLYC